MPLYVSRHYRDILTLRRLTYTNVMAAIFRVLHIRRTVVSRYDSSSINGLLKDSC